MQGKIKMIEVKYYDGTEWKTAKTSKLCKLLKRVFGKHATTIGHGSNGYYDVAIWNYGAGKSGDFVGKVYISTDIDLPEDFF